VCIVTTVLYRVQTTSFQIIRNPQSCFHFEIPCFCDMTLCTISLLTSFHVMLYNSGCVVTQINIHNLLIGSYLSPQILYSAIKCLIIPRPLSTLQSAIKVRAVGSLARTVAQWAGAVCRGAQPSHTEAHFPVHREFSLPLFSLTASAHLLLFFQRLSLAATHRIFIYLYSSLMKLSRLA
jgi:hypothetical protein